MNNYIFNKGLYKPVGGFITRQDGCGVSGLRYGRFKKTVEKNGCGAVAVFNVMKLLGTEQDFCAVLRELEKLRLPWLFGVFGTKPRGLRKYFDMHKVPYKLFGAADEFKSALKGCRCAVVCAKNSKSIRNGIHFYTVFPSENGIKSLNYHYADTPLDYSVKEIKPDRFIAGYIF